MCEIWENIDLTDLEGEIWRNIENYPNYQVSNLGRVKSLNHRRTGREKILVQSFNNGYLLVKLYDGNGGGKNHRVHRLVAKAFVHNDSPNEKIYIDHYDTNRSNNKANNLRWVTSIENMNNYLTKQHMSQATKGLRTGEKHHHTKKCICNNIIFS